MAIDDRTRIAIPVILRITLIGSLAGAVYGYFAASALGAPGVFGVERGLVTGGLVSVVLSSLNILVLQTSIGGGVPRTPFLLHLALKSLIYLVVFLAAIAAGQWLVPDPSASGLQIGLRDLIFFIGISFVLGF